MADETPGSTPGQSVFKQEAGTDSVFGLIEVCTIRAIAVGTCDDTKEMLQDV